MAGTQVKPLAPKRYAGKDTTHHRRGRSLHGHQEIVSAQADDEEGNTVLQTQRKLCYFDLQDLDKWMRRIRIASYQETDSQVQGYIIRKDMLGK